MKTIAISTLASAFLCAALLSAQAPAAAARPAKTPDLSKYPAAVRATIERETAHAALKGVSKEVEKGKTQYEVETTIDGKSRDLLVDPSGRLIEVEEEIALASAPAAVQDALKPRGTVLKLERVERSGVTTYEGAVKGRNGKKTSVALDAHGKPTKG